MPETAPDLNAVRAARRWKSPSLIGRGVLELCQLADVVFLGLHGACGEDGRIQAALDLLGVPYTGSGHLASALAMDKAATKSIVAAAGLRTPESRVVEYVREDIPRLSRRFTCRASSSRWTAARAWACPFPPAKPKWRARWRKTSRSGACSWRTTFGGARSTSPCWRTARCRPSKSSRARDSTTIAASIRRGRRRKSVPRRSTPPPTRRLREAALTAHRRLGLKDYSRADFMLDEAGEIWFLEINTLPGMTPTSLLPQEAAAAGVDYEALCQRLAELALKGRMA